MAALRTPGSPALAAAAALVVVLIVPGPARGCSCTDIPLSEYADAVAVAFSGRQIERIDHANDHGTDLSTTLVLEVHKLYKGQAGPLVEVRTRPGGGDCGTDFLRRDFTGVAAVTGVAAFGEDAGGLSVHLCGSHVSISELEEVFGPGRPPDETITLPADTDETSTAEAVLITAAAVLFAGGAAAMMRRKRQAEGE